MAIQKYAGDRVTGLSTDTKPTNIADGAVFFETDTRKIYLKGAGVWAEVDYDNYTDAEAVSAIKADEDWNATDWDTAYGWGDHSVAGYLTDAASDGKTYGRKDGDWAEVTSTGGSAKLVLLDKTDDYSIQVGDLAKVITMTATVSKTLTLPSVTATDIGLHFTIIKKGSGDLVIQASDSDTILDSSAGGTLSNLVATDIYSTISLALISETEWIVSNATSGYWVTA